MNHTQLSNGLRVIHEPTNSPIIYCGYAINVGTRDELPNEQGMAHFVEHLLFKGTQQRRPWQILNSLDRVGGDLNAYTTKEETMVHATIMRPHFSRAVDLLTDLVFRSVFLPEEMKKEVEVIIDEIRSYADSPAEQIFDDFETQLFGIHALGHSILGIPEQLLRFTTDDVKRFAERYYYPENMVFFVRGGLSFHQIVRTLEKHTADIPVGHRSAAQRQSPAPTTPKEVTQRRSIHQAHVILGARSYSAFDPKHAAVFLLNNLLGGPALNSRLNMSLRERSGLVYTVESGVTAYTDTGVFNIYFGTDDADVARCMKLVRKELKRLCQFALTPTQLHAAKRQLVGQLSIAAEHYESRTLGMAKIFLHYDKYETIEDTFRRIDALTPALLLETANETLAPDRLHVLSYQSDAPN
ncbi:MAG: insulinase family protein [Prevotellaceae bacterium]|jgi:predicted Zn-dependent peptidase|nr:insulinase family protein [Prevotellaceae bacterium]